MNEKILIATLGILFIPVVLGSNIWIGHILIRKEAKNRNWRLIKASLDKRGFPFGSNSRQREMNYDVIYENEKGEIMNPTVAVGAWGLWLRVEEDYPILRGKKY